LNDPKFQPNLRPFLNQGIQDDSLDELKNIYFKDGYWNQRTYPAVRRENTCIICLIPLNYERAFICSQKPSWFKQFPIMEDKYDKNTKSFNHVHFRDSRTSRVSCDYIWKDSEYWYVSFNPVCYEIFVFKNRSPNDVNWLTWLIIMIYNLERHRHYNLDGISIIHSSKKQLYYYIKYAGKCTKKWKPQQCISCDKPVNTDYNCPSCKQPMCGKCSKTDVIVIYEDWCQIENECSICKKVYCRDCIKACYQHVNLLGMEGFDDTPSICKPCLGKNQYKLHKVQFCEYHNWYLCASCTLKFKDGVEEHFEYSCLECKSNSDYCERYGMF